MILTQVSYVDCVAFLVFLIPQLLLNVNIFELLRYGLQTLPFIALILPCQFIVGRYLTSKRQRVPFVEQASPFQDIVVRCVRYAFARLPANIGRVFFSKAVSLPFMSFRLLRHGYLRSPVFWREVDTDRVRGIWIIHDETKKPDIVIYYCHGGGFSMGSAYFYLEPLLALLTILKPHYSNPAIFALEYTLVPDATYPTQLVETIAGYDLVLNRISHDASRICVAGDSAGGTLVLALLLHLANGKDFERRRPGYCTLISPWVTLVCSKNRNTASDYLDANSLHRYGSQYASDSSNLSKSMVSPGCCTDPAWWARAMPVKGLYIAFGSEEVFAPEIELLIWRLRKSGIGVSVREEPGGIHAWVIAALFLEATMENRIKRMKDLVKSIVVNIEAVD